jgi:uncharacterized RDD family membrane protein YckC
MTTPNPYAPPTAEVQDIYDPTAPMELADRGTRLAAAIVDGIIIGCMWYLPFVVAMIVGGGFDADGPDGGVILGGALFATAGFAVWCWFTVRYVLANGQSIAKRMLGIKVVRSDGSPVSLGRIFWLRNVVNGLLGIIGPYQIVDWLFIFGESRQCLHDKLADTIVIRA